MAFGRPCEHTEGRGHDCAYVNWRESLIPLAEATANSVVGKRQPEAYAEAAKWRRRWDAAFCRAMDRLATDPFMRLAITAGRKAAA